jgi:hypothetical protein
VPGGPSLDHNLQLAVKPGHLCLSQKKRYIYINKKRRVPGALLRGHNLQLAVNPGHLCRSQKKRNIYKKKRGACGACAWGAFSWATTCNWLSTLAIDVFACRLKEWKRGTYGSKPSKSHHCIHFLFCPQPL